MPARIAEATPEEAKDFFAAQHSTVVTFFGYSGAGYQDPAFLAAQATRILAQFDPKTTLVNGGATLVGIGAVYALAKQAGFRTAGIVSSQARDEGVPLSPCVDVVFYIRDSTWGGLLPRTRTLAPTSQAMVAVSDILVAIGGGEVARDELQAARAVGKQLILIPADFNHDIAIKKAHAKQLPAPTDFRGAVHQALLPER